MAIRTIDSFPTHRLGDLAYRPGHVFPFGASLLGDSVNFSLYSREATAVSLLLYRHGSHEPFAEIPLTDEFRVGSVYAVRVFGLNIDTIEYGYRIDGPHDPENGLLFDPGKPLLDPYAHGVTGRAVWGAAPDTRNPFPHRGQIIRDDYDWEGDTLLEIPQKDLVICELHVRGYTRHPSSGVKYPGTFAGLRAKIPYLKELGINCVELMPIFAFDEFEYAREYEGRRLLNYWGYSATCFFAPKAGYAASGPYGMEADELKGLIKALHASGIEVILDVVFNHTAEGNENGPTISYRGIDNRTYYMLTEDGHYLNYSGCGNTLNCNNSVVRGSILDCLRYWVSTYHIDGFRFDLASILTRDEKGEPMVSPPLLESLAHDAVLGSCKLIAEAWDAGGLYQVGSFPSWQRFSEWNGRYRDCVRRFVKGDAGCAPELYERIAGSPDLYGERGPQASINFITCHDGFTLWDLVSYNEKHNAANGEDNRDGANDNASWNCGAEGETQDASVNALRRRQMRNFLLILLTSRGVPMLLSGDEFENTQFGNNNAYCQDNEISWIDWGRTGGDRSLHDYVQALLAQRSAHPVLRSESFFMGYNGTGYPELSFHGPAPWTLDRTKPCLSFAYLYAEDHAKEGTETDAFLYILINAWWEPCDFTFPIVPAGFSWYLVAGSEHGAHLPGAEQLLERQDGLTLGPRSSAFLLARPEQNSTSDG